MIKLFCRRLCSTRVRFCSTFGTNGANHQKLSDTRNESANEKEIRKLLYNAASGIDMDNVSKDDQWLTEPYVWGTYLETGPPKEIGVERIKMDPEDTSIILFPGYATQFVGMAKSLEIIPKARDIFDRASEVMGYDVLKMCNEGPKKTLNEIVNSHIAIVVTSLANIEKLQETRPNSVRDCLGVAGLGIGEITALIFAGAFQFEQALHLVRIRAEAILAANEINQGGMLSVYYGAGSRVMDACRAAEAWCINNGHPNAVCFTSGRMFPRYQYISGTNEALDYLEKNYEEFNIRGVRRVKNALPLHCRIMKPAAGPFQEALDQMSIEKPIIKVHSNYDAHAYMSSAHIRRNLTKQLYNPIKWEQTLHQIFARTPGLKFPRVYTMGPGYTLRYPLKQVNLLAWQRSMNIGDVSRRKTIRSIQKRENMNAMLNDYKEEILDRASGFEPYPCVEGGPSPQQIF